MVARTWQNAKAGFFRDPANWSPSGAPVSGDTLSIKQGIVLAPFDWLAGLGIDFGSPAVERGTPAGPVPQLLLLDGGIASDSSITTPSGASLSPPRAGLIQAVGRTVNYGTITVTAFDGHAGAAASLGLNINDLSLPGGCIVQHGEFINRGLIVQSGDGDLNITGTGPKGVDPTAELRNDGTISASGPSGIRLDTNLVGHGTVKLAYGGTSAGAAAGALEVQSDVRCVGAGETISFSVGHLLIDNPATRFLATIDHFGETTPPPFAGFPGPTDAISLKDFQATHETFRNHVLTLWDARGCTETLRFAGTHTLADFAFTTSSQGTTILPAKAATTNTAFGRIGFYPEAATPYAGNIATLLATAGNQPGGLPVIMPPTNG